MISDEVGVVVLAYGGSGRHIPLIESLLDEGVPSGAVLVVHNRAESGEAAPFVPRGCEIVETGANLGYAGGMNMGLARMRERGVALVLLLTHDARLRTGALAQLLAAMAARPNFGILGPTLLLSGTEIPFSYGGQTSSTGATSHVKERPQALDDGIFACDWIDGGTMLVRREVVDLVGDFDERFWGYCEDSDFCLRATSVGFGVGVVMDAQADQEPGGSRRPGAWAYLMTRNGIAYAHRARGRPGLFGALGRAGWLVALSAARAALRALRLRPGPSRELWVLAIGAGAGAVDYLRGRWGAPPTGLPGMGDLRNV